MPLTLEIITPAGRVYCDEVAYVMIPSVEGDMGILPGHIPLLTAIHPGVIDVIRSGHKERFTVDKGFVRIKADTVSVLTEAAIDLEAQ